MTIERDIATALLTAAQAVATAQTLDIDMPNVVFKIPDGKGWLEARQFANTNLTPTWGNDEVQLGIFQISVKWPVDAGSIAPLEIAGQIKAAFAKGTVLRSGVAVVRIEANPTVMSAIIDGQKATYPVSIPYRASI